MNWLLIRGLVREKQHWYDFPNILKKATGANHVAAIDMPGIGEFHNLPAPLNMQENVEFLREQFLQLKSRHEGDWSLVAVSLGGMVGMSWIDSHPNDFKKFVIINSSAGNLSSPFKRLVPSAIKKILKLFFSNNLYQREKTILELTVNMKPITEDLIRTWEGFELEHPIKRSTFLKQLKVAATFQIPDQLPIPILVLSSETDRLTNSECSKLIAQHFKLPHHIHPKAGHDLCLDDPQWVAEHIKNWSPSTA